MAGQGQTYRDTTVRLCEAVGDGWLIENATFERCEIAGPAIVMFEGENSLTNTTFGGRPDDILYRVPEDRRGFSGVILLRGCTIHGCRFDNVGFMGPSDFVRYIRNNVSP